MDDDSVDLLIGAEAIRAFLVHLGWSKTTTIHDVYYLKRSGGGWPIGGTAGSKGGKLIASKRRIAHHIDKLTCGQSK